MTAGQGIVHAEMFPLLRRDGPNPTELFQIWINLPRSNKFVNPHFSMLWNETIPDLTLRDAAGKTTRVRVVAGRVAGASAPAPPPDSWAARRDSEVQIWTLKMAPGATYQLPGGSPGANRTLYFFSGSELTVGGQRVSAGAAIRIRPDATTPLVNGRSESEALMLHGQPIQEPVARRGPFVMNDSDELQRAFTDYRATEFGGWPWPTHDPVHAPTQGRFAIHADGRRDEPV
jgi:redox-sensitive bicupin YhaK (pirin superfamily)